MRTPERRAEEPSLTMEAILIVCVYGVVVRGGVQEGDGEMEIGKGGTRL